MREPKDRLDKSSEWNGVLTKDTVQNFVLRLQQLLRGQKFTFIAVNEFSGARIDLRINQTLSAKVVMKLPVGDGGYISLATEPIKNPDWFHISLCYSGGVCSITPDTDFHFFPGTEYEPERVVLEFKSGAGYDISWVFYPTGPINE